MKMQAKSDCQQSPNDAAWFGLPYGLPEAIEPYNGSFKEITTIHDSERMWQHIINIQSWLLIIVINRFGFPDSLSLLTHFLES